MQPETSWRAAMPAIRPKADVTFGILGRSRRLVESGEKQSMNREMLKQQITGTIVTWHGVDSLSQLADRILALLPPPATAKLPEGVEIVKSGTERSATVWNVRHGVQYLNTMHGWGGYYRRTDFMDDATALTAALSAPPVPGEKPTNKPDMLRVTVGDGKYTLVQDGEGKQFALRYGEPWRDLVGDGLTLSLGYELDAARARIAELEADNTRLRAQYDMVEQERTRLMLGQQVPYTPAEKPDARNFVATGEQRQDDYYEKPITETKPDPLARAVTVGEFNEKMQRLADIYVRAGMPTTAKFIRDAFTSTQGAAHAE